MRYGGYPHLMRSDVAGYLLDTSALIDWLGGVSPVASLLERLTQEGHSVAICCVSVAELYSGLADDEHPIADQFIRPLQYWDIDGETAELAGRFRYVYARQGFQLSAPDALQAALAVRNDATLVTGNIRDFPMPDLQLEKLPPV